LGGIGSLAGAGTGTAGTGGTFLSRVGEFIMPGQDKVGLFGNIGKGIGSLFGGAGQSPEEAAKVLMAQAEGNPALTEQISRLVAQGYGPDEILQMVGSSEFNTPVMSAVDFLPGQSGPSFGSDPYTQSLLDREQQARTGRNPLLAFLDDKLGLDLSGKGLLGSIKNIGGGEGGGIGLGGAGIAALLDEAKNRKGVPLTPLTQMDAAGRYNIEAEIARRMGKEKPSPVEFGLLPAGTLPQLSGGRPTPRFKALPVGPGSGIPLRNIRPYSDRESAGEMDRVPAVMMNGGMVAPMRYAEGGNVAMEEFERMNGDINGPGTETSDDVPAMLSDGEFVMTGRAVRGAGAFDMSKGEGGIITLTPNKDEDRDRGTALMYDMMDLFSDFAGART
jgi:hypothetical protein